MSNDNSFTFINGTNGIKAFLNHMGEVFSEKWGKRDVSTPKYILGFHPVHVEPNQDLNVTHRPQLPFRPEYLLIPATIAEFFQIRDIKFGHYSQFIASGEVPASMFSENAPINRLKMDPCSDSTPITISVRNTDDRPHVFAAALIGPPPGADMKDYVAVDGQMYYWSFSVEPNMLTIYPVTSDVFSCNIRVSENLSDMSKDAKILFICDQIRKHFPVHDRELSTKESDELHRKSSGAIK